MGAEYFYAERIRPEFNEDKYYELTLPPTGTDVFAHFGRRGTRGQVYVYYCGTRAQAEAKYHEKVLEKRRKGYVGKSGHQPDGTLFLNGEKLTVVTFNAQGKETKAARAPTREETQQWAEAWASIGQRGRFGDV